MRNMKCKIDFQTRDYVAAVSECVYGYVCEFMCLCMCVCVCVCVCMCVYVCERESVYERDSVCVFKRERKCVRNNDKV